MLLTHKETRMVEKLIKEGLSYNEVAEYTGLPKKSVINCPICNYEMIEMQSCHLICKNCGAHLDCSDKGSFW